MVRRIIMRTGRGRIKAGSPLPVVAFEVPDGPDSFEPIGVSATGAVAWSSPEGIRLRPPGALSAHLIPGTASEYQTPFDFSPDGESLVFQASSDGRTLWVAMEGGGSSPRVVAYELEERSDGMHAVSERVVLTSDTRLHTASTSPDGRLLAFISTSPELRLGSARLVVVSNWLEVLREQMGR